MFNFKHSEESQALTSLMDGIICKCYTCICDGCVPGATGSASYAKLEQGSSKSPTRGTVKV